jgi:hypothetical protein
MAAAAILALGAAIVWMVGQPSLERRPSSFGLAGRSGGHPERLVVPPGDDPSAIALPVENAPLIEIDRDGTLLVHAGSRVKRQQKPRAYQDIDGRRSDVAVRFDIAATGAPRLVVGPYDRTRSLVIDLQPGKDDLQP